MSFLPLGLVTSASTTRPSVSTGEDGDRPDAAVARLLGIDRAHQLLDDELGGLEDRHAALTRERPRHQVLVRLAFALEVEPRVARAGARMLRFRLPATAAPRGHRAHRAEIDERFAYAGHGLELDHLHEPRRTFEAEAHHVAAPDRVLDERDLTAQQPDHDGQGNREREPRESPRLAPALVEIRFDTMLHIGLL
jgi:hypothetical protein